MNSTVCSRIGLPKFLGSYNDWADFQPTEGFLRLARNLSYKTRRLVVQVIKYAFSECSIKLYK